MLSASNSARRTLLRRLSRDLRDSVATTGETGTRGGGGERARSTARRARPRPVLPSLRRFDSYALWPHSPRTQCDPDRRKTNHHTYDELPSMLLPGSRNGIVSHGGFCLLRVLVVLPPVPLRLPVCLCGARSFPALCFVSSCTCAVLVCLSRRWSNAAVRPDADSRMRTHREGSRSCAEPLCERRPRRGCLCLFSLVRRLLPRESGRWLCSEIGRGIPLSISAISMVALSEVSTTHTTTQEHHKHHKQAEKRGMRRSLRNDHSRNTACMLVCTQHSSATGVGTVLYLCNPDRTQIRCYSAHTQGETEARRTDGMGHSTVRLRPLFCGVLVLAVRGFNESALACRPFLSLCALCAHSSASCSVPCLCPPVTQGNTLPVSQWRRPAGTLHDPELGSQCSLTNADLMGFAVFDKDVATTQAIAQQSSRASGASHLTAVGSFTQTPVRVMSTAATQFAQRCRKIVAVGRNFAGQSARLRVASAVKFDCAYLTCTCCLAAVLSSCEGAEQSHSEVSAAVPQAAQLHHHKGTICQSAASVHMDKTSDETRGEGDTRHSRAVLLCAYQLAARIFTTRLSSA